MWSPQFNSPAGLSWPQLASAGLGWPQLASAALGWPQLASARLAPRCPGQAPEALSWNTTQSPEPHSVMIYHTMKFASLCCVTRAPVFWGEFASGVSIQACPRKRPKRHPRPASDGLPEGPRQPLPNQAQKKLAKTRKRSQREAHFPDRRGRG